MLTLTCDGITIIPNKLVCIIKNLSLIGNMVNVDRENPQKQKSLESLVIVFKNVKRFQIQKF